MPCTTYIDGPQNRLSRAIHRFTTDRHLAERLHRAFDPVFAEEERRNAAETYALRGAIVRLGQENEQALQRERHARLMRSMHGPYREAEMKVLSYRLEMTRISKEATDMINEMEAQLEEKNEEIDRLKAEIDLLRVEPSKAGYVKQEGGRIKQEGDHIKEEGRHIKQEGSD